MAQSGQVPIVVAQATRVYGISIPNPEAASLTRKVIRLSLVLLLLQATYSIYNTVALNQRDFVYFSFLGALIPMCGYCEWLCLFLLPSRLISFRFLRKRVAQHFSIEMLSTLSRERALR